MSFITQIFPKLKKKISENLKQPNAKVMDEIKMWFKTWKNKLINKLRSKFY